MTEIRVGLHGHKELQDKLKQMGKRAEDIVRLATAAVATDVQAEAKRRVARNFGRAASAIRIVYRDDKLEARVGIFEGATVGSWPVNYGYFIEKGRRAGRWPPIEQFTGRTESLDLWAQRKLGSREAAFGVAKKIGTKGTKAQPFLLPALEDRGPRYPEVVAQLLEQGLVP